MHRAVVTAASPIPAETILATLDSQYNSLSAASPLPQLPLAGNSSEALEGLLRLLYAYVADNTTTVLTAPAMQIRSIISLADKHSMQGVLKQLDILLADWVRQEPAALWSNAEEAYQWMEAALSITLALSQLNTCIVARLIQESEWIQVHAPRLIAWIKQSLHVDHVDIVIGIMPALLSVPTCTSDVCVRPR